MTRSQNRWTTLLLAFAVLAIALPVSAQDRGAFSAGWRLLHFTEAGVDGEGETMPAGWYADVAYDVDEMISFVGDVSGAYKSTDFEATVLNVTVSREANIKIHTFMGGVRFTARQSAMRPFAQVLFGAAHASADVDETVSRPGAPSVSSQSSTSSNELAFDVGGGFSFPATENLDMRVGASYLRIGGDGGGNGFRLSLGAIFPF